MSLLRGLLLSFALLISPLATAGPGQCPTDADRAQFNAFRDRIAAAESPEAARELALSQTRIGQLAMAQASRVLPHDAELAEAQARLSAFEVGVGASRTQEEVAGQFDALTQSSTAGRCDYSNPEIVIIILGFLLGILPGILFLFLFC